MNFHGLEKHGNEIIGQHERKLIILDFDSAGLILLFCSFSSQGKVINSDFSVQNFTR